MINSEVIPETNWDRRYERQEKILKVVSRSGVSSILFSLDENPMRFSQLMFKTKLNPGILDRHLKSLVQLKIVEKVSDGYILTDSGKRLVSILEELFSIIGK